jgi:hypothetical protein
MAKRSTILVPNREVNRRPNVERRAWGRFATAQRLVVRAASTADELGTGCWGRLRDVSPDGLALRLSRFFAPGCLLIIELPDNVKKGAHSFPVQVVHVTPERKRLWIIGCEFIRPLGQEELRAFVKE